MIFRKLVLTLIVNILLCNLCCLNISIADTRPNAKHAKQILKQTKHKPPLETSLVIDAKTGKILHARNVKKRIYPASLTKVMTLYMLFDALESGRVKPDQKLFISNYATKVVPLKLNLKAGDHITAKDAALGMIVHSANDAAKVVAENLGGSEARFARLMTVKARQLGMKDTIFKNASGLHDAKQFSTATDLAKLTLAIKRDFPRYYPLFASNSFDFKGRTIKGHNKVSATYAGAEGLKTGYTFRSGYNLITTATRGNKSFVAVVIGSPRAVHRDEKMMSLLDQHFGKRYYVSRDKVKEKQVVNKKGVAKGRKHSVKMAAKPKTQGRRVVRG